MKLTRRNFLSTTVGTTALVSLAGCADPQNKPSDMQYNATVSGVDDAQQIDSVKVSATGQIEPQFRLVMTLSQPIKTPRHILVDYGTETITTTFLQGDETNVQITFHDRHRDGTYRVRVLDSDKNNIDTAYFKFENAPV